MNDELLITLSAYADGELDARARLEFEQQLAQHPEWQRDLAQFKQLDAAAAKLPVPDVSAKLAALPGTVEIRAGCDAPLTPRLVNALQAVPAIPPERFMEVWNAVAARITALQRARAAIAGSPDAQPAVPQVSAEKWDGVWKKIETRVSERNPRPASARAKIVALPQSGSGHRSRWRWLAATTAAAVLAVVLLLKLLPQTSTNPVPPANPDESVALELPKPVNERYDITIEYVKGDPVVCYYLKPDERPAETNRDWRWLPD